MSRRELISGFWAAMQTNDSERAASYLAAGCVIAWPCSEERIVGPSEFAAIQARYPTKTGQRSFEVHRLVVEGDTVVSEVTVILLLGPASRSSATALVLPSAVIP